MNIPHELTCVSTGSRLKTKAWISTNSNQPNNNFFQVKKKTTNPNIHSWRKPETPGSGAEWGEVRTRARCSKVLWRSSTEASVILTVAVGCSYVSPRLPTFLWRKQNSFSCSRYSPQQSHIHRQNPKPHVPRKQLGHWARMSWCSGLQLHELWGYQVTPYQMMSAMSMSCGVIDLALQAANPSKTNGFTSR